MSAPAPRPADSRHAAPRDPLMPHLALHDLGVAGRLHQVSLRITAGECVGLIGPNGAGKSTLLRAALGALPATGDSSLTGIPLSARPRHVAYLAQDRAMVWPMAARDCVALGWRAHPDHRGDGLAAAEAALDAVGLAGFGPRPVTGLSGGEKAAVLLARALAQGAGLLLADEPAAALDPAQAQRCLSLLRAKADAGGAVLSALHDLPLAARFCTRLVVMDGGRVIADDSPAAIMGGPVLPRVFGVTAHPVMIGGSRHWTLA